MLIIDGIGKNIWVIDCIIQYATEKNIQGLLLFIDFERAFGSLESTFILNSTSRPFSFGTVPLKLTLSLKPRGLDPRNSKFLSFESRV